MKNAKANRGKDCVRVQSGRGDLPPNFFRRTQSLPPRALEKQTQLLTTQEVEHIYDKLDEYDIETLIIKERNQDVKQLESDMIDISEISSDIALLVHSQGENLDLAFDNIVVAEENTTQGVENVEGAYKFVEKARKFGYAFLGGGAGVAGVGIGVAFLSPIAGAITASVGVISILFGINKIK